MAFSTGKDLHVNVPLSRIAMAYQPTGMIAPEIAPIVTVNKQSDAYTIYSIADAYRIEEDKRAPGGEAQKIYRSISSATYFADNYALKDDIPYEDIENADAGLLLTKRSERVKYVKNKLYLNWERRLALQVTSGSNVGSYSGVGSNWSDATDGNSDPIGDIFTAKDNVFYVTGYEPNRIIFSRKAWRYFREHGNVITRLYGHQTSSKGRLVTVGMAKDLLEVEHVHIGSALYNTTQEGQTESLSDIWGTDVLVYYAPTNPTAEAPSFMYSFRWNKVMNMVAQIHQVPRQHKEEVELGYYQDEKITGSTLGFLITDVRSSV
jgi:hypothetical protein